MPEGGVAYGPQGVGKSISYMGGGIWAGWSGAVSVDNELKEMFNFIAPDTALRVLNFQYYIDLQTGSPDTHEYIGWDLTIDDIPIIVNRWKATTTMHFSDIDMNSFVIPANSTCVIESYTNHSGGIPTYGLLTLKQMSSNQ
jgi:hypothetical protein